jgi:hypothetical protein
MKKVELTLFLTAGLILVLFAGCFSPISVMQREEVNLEGQGDKPFSVNVYVGGARSVVGASMVQTKAGLYNFIQLIVLDESGTIIAFDEIRQHDSGQKSAILQIDAVTQKQHYYFLLLFGYWERNIDAESTDAYGVTTYVYNENAKPVLLASGYQTEELSGGGTVTVTMHPLVIDTVFLAPAQTLEPVLAEAAEIIQCRSWNVRWTIGRDGGESGNYNGLASLLEAQSQINPSSGLAVAAKRYIMNGLVSSSESAGTTTNVIEFPLPALDAMTDIGTDYSVNFNLEYVPFGLTNTDWSEFDAESVFDLSSFPPAWIIRNGLNDAAQNAGTDFDKAGKPGPDYNYKIYNGNGGVAARVKEYLGFTDEILDGGYPGFPDNAYDGDSKGRKDGFPDGRGTANVNDLIIYGGLFRGPTNSINVEIDFTLIGYSSAETALVYYGVTKGGAYSSVNPLPYNMFTQTLGSYGPGSRTYIPISLPATDDQDIWLTFRMADGRVSNRIAINTAKGDITIVIPWG